MKTILLIISIMVFGLYSCGDEVNNTEEKKEEQLLFNEFIRDQGLSR